ncbi:hypothetical protein SMICM304S_04898 [Streptomyces microflavus]
MARQMSARGPRSVRPTRRTVRQPAAGPGGDAARPRREFVDAFDADASAPAGTPDARPGAGAAGPPVEPDEALGGESSERRDAKGGKGRTFTGIAAAAVTTVLAVVVAGQVADDSAGREAAAARAAGVDRDGGEGASRSDARPTPEQPASKPPEVKPLSYAERMAQPVPLAADLKATGKFEAVPGLAKAPGKGQKHRYRIDVEKGLSLDAGLFAEAARRRERRPELGANGATTFERISSGKPDSVITLASPGTTGDGVPNPVWTRRSTMSRAIPPRPTA